METSEVSCNNNPYNPLRRDLNCTVPGKQPMFPVETIHTGKQNRSV